MPPGTAEKDGDMASPIAKAVTIVVGLVSALVLWMACSSRPMWAGWTLWLPAIGVGMFVLQIVCSVLLGYGGYVYVTVFLAAAASVVFVGLRSQLPELGWREFGSTLAGTAGVSGWIFACLLRAEIYGQGWGMRTSRWVYEVEDLPDGKRSKG
jgi:hypothetical protein